MTTFDKDKAERLVAEARESRRCKECHGDGYKTYSDTSCGRGGGGGQMLTTAECHRCKGQGWIGAVDVSQLAEQLEAACGELERRPTEALHVAVRDTAYAWQRDCHTAEAERSSLQSRLRELEQENERMRGLLATPCETEVRWRNNGRGPRVEFEVGREDFVVTAERAKSLGAALLRAATEATATKEHLP